MTLVCAPRLHQPDSRIDQNNDQYHQCVDQIAQHAGYHCSRQQHQNHEVAELLQDQRAQAALVCCGQRVGAKLERAVIDLVHMQTVSRVYAMLLRECVNLLQVPLARRLGRGG